MSQSVQAKTLRAVLDAWGLADARAEPHGDGLINTTYAISDGAGTRRILQRINPIFAPQIHHNIEAVTAQLERAGIHTPRLLPTSAGALWLAHEGEIWRMQSAVAGVSFNALGDREQARAAGHFVGRWHAALRELDHSFVALRGGVHDTAKHLATLREALADHETHRLYPAFAPLAEQILAAAEQLEPLPECPLRVAHGDLKINNMMFAGASGPGSREPLALIDLDTVAPMTLAHELGDAWRSWCNRATEDEPEARFDLELFDASFTGWRAGFALPIEQAELTSLLLAPEWISLELAARFAADSVNERYFGWSPERFATRGEHNLVRARSQWSLHLALASSRSPRARLLGLSE